MTDNTSDEYVYIVGNVARLCGGFVDLPTARDLASYTFHSPDDFVARWPLNRPGCVVVELGHFTTRVAHTISQIPCIPFIIAAEELTAKRAVQLMEMGAFTVVTKPFTAAELFAAVRRAICSDAEGLSLSDEAKRLIEIGQTLTDKDRYMLKLVSGGTLNKVIAGKLNLSLRSVERRRADLMHKLEAKTAAEAVAKFIRYQSLVEKHQHVQGPHWIENRAVGAKRDQTPSS